MAAETVESPFELDVDPEQLRELRTTFDRVAEELERRGSRISAAAGSVQGEWSGRSARRTRREMEGLGGHVGRFSGLLQGSAKAVGRLAGSYERGLERVIRLNAAWDEALAEHRAAMASGEAEYEERRAASRVELAAKPGPLGRSAPSSASTPVQSVMAFDPTYRATLAGAGEELIAEQRRLRAAFEDLAERLGDRTAECARSLNGDVPLPVAPATVELYRRFGWTGVSLDQPLFDVSMPLSRADELADVALPETADPGEKETLTDHFGITGWTGGTFMAAWAEQQTRVYLAGYYAARGITDPRVVEGLLHVNKFTQGVPLVGHAVTVAGIGNDVRNGASVSGSVLAAGVGTATVALVVATAPVSVPVSLAVAAGVGLSVVTVGFTKRALDTDVGTFLTAMADANLKRRAGEVEEFFEPATDLLSAGARSTEIVTGVAVAGARMAWKKVFE